MIVSGNNEVILELKVKVKCPANFLFHQLQEDGKETVYLVLHIRKTSADRVADRIQSCHKDDSKLFTISFKTTLARVLFTFVHLLHFLQDP